MTRKLPELELIPMPASDIGHVTEMNRRLQEDEGAEVMPLDKIEQRLRQWIDSSRYRVLLIKDADKILGYLIYDLTPQENGAIYLRQLFIDRTFRRQGYASAAVKAFTEAFTGPTRQVEADVLVMNQTGRAFWESLGFRPRYTRMRLDTLNSPDDRNG